MHRDKRCIITSYFFIDTLLIALSLYVPYCFEYSKNFIPQNLPYFKDIVLLFILWGGMLVIFLRIKNLYTTDRSLSIPKEVWRVFGCVLLASILAGLMIFILQIKFFLPQVFFQSFLLLFFSLSFWRVVKRLFIRSRLAKGFYNYNILIVGAGEAGKMIASEIKNRPYLGFNIVGFFDTYKTGSVSGYKILSGKIEEFEEILQKYFIDEVYITIPSQRLLVNRIMVICRLMKKAVRILADNFSLPFYRLELRHIGMLPVVKYIESELHGTELYIKRITDIIISIFGLLVLSPLFVLIAVLIKLDSSGPVFYKSLRCGKKGRLFNFYKFRSMQEGADRNKATLADKSEVKGPVFKIKDDPRLTRIGRILRRWSLDELPQLLNVLKGDMSLVGPRPPLEEEVKEYDVWQMRRLEIRPGITGLWQARGRSNLSFYKWVKLDLWYIDNWSFYLDLLILFWTIPAVLKKKGAY